MTIRSVLWDFGDTLADQDWLLEAPEGFPDWPRAWFEIARGTLEHEWYVGDVSTEDIAHEVSELLGMPVALAIEHIRHRCHNIRFFEAVLTAARDCSLPQAIVTVNPDAFTRFVVPFYRLDDLFPVIVTSWQEGTVDKAELCARAVQRLDAECVDGQALLIDNIEANVRAWERAGGQGYVFRGETLFLSDLGASLAQLKRDGTA